MKYVAFCPLFNFDFWAGAEKFARRLTCDEFSKIEYFLEGEYDELTETEINDIFWFESDFLISDVLGLDVDEFWKRE